MSGFSFKASSVEPRESQEFAPITPGIYTVQFQDLQEKKTQAGGVQWSGLLKITAGEKFVGRTFWMNWNVENANPQAQEIARREIVQIAHCLGVDADDISIETLKSNKHLQVTLNVGEYMGKPQYNAKKWESVDGKTSPSLPTQAAGKLNTETKNESKPVGKPKPWELKK